MNEVVLTEDEVRLLISVVKSASPPLDVQIKIYNLINRIEKELGIE